MPFVKAAALGIARFLLGSAVTRYYDIHRLARQPVQTAKSPEAEKAAEVAKIVPERAFMGVWLRETSSAGRKGRSTEPAESELAT